MELVQCNKNRQKQMDWPQRPTVNKIETYVFSCVVRSNRNVPYNMNIVAIYNDTNSSLRSTSSR